MTAALAAALCISVAAGVGVIAARRRRRRERLLATWTDTAARARPVVVDLGSFGLVVPPPGRLLAVVFTHPDCSGCDPVRRRVDSLTDVDVAAVDVAAEAHRARAAGVTSVPTLVLVDHAGDVVRSWIGTPLAGVVEETVAHVLEGR